MLFPVMDGPPYYYWPHQRAIDAAKSHQKGCECVCCCDRKGKERMRDPEFRRQLRAAFPDITLGPSE